MIATIENAPWLFLLLVACGLALLVLVGWLENRDDT